MSLILKLKVLVIFLTAVAVNSFGQSFQPAPPMNVARATHTATLLNNGTVLVTGGLTLIGPASDTAEIYDPGTHAWRLLPARMTVSRADARAVKLQDGRVLIVGGAASPSAEIFDPLTEQFSATGAPTTLFGNAYHSSLILLDDGRVLGVTGTLTSFIYPFPGASEIYDPATNTWTATADIPVGVSAAASVKLQNGKVLATGGYDGFTRTAYGTVEMYDPLADSSQAMASLLQSRLDHTATLLPDGKVLIAGGTDPSYSTNLVELYDASVQPNGSSSFTAPLQDRRRHHTATQIPNGDVLVIGGFQSPHGGFIDAYLASAELYSVTDGTWSPAGSMATPRSHHTATLLPSGQVLVTGGGTQGVNCCDPPTNSTEIWMDTATFQRIQLICRPLDPLPGHFGQQAPLIARHCYFAVTSGINDKSTYGAYDIQGKLTPALNGDLVNGNFKVPGGCSSGVLGSDCIDIPILKFQNFTDLVAQLNTAVNAGSQGRYDRVENNSNFWVQQQIDKLHLAVNLPSNIIASEDDLCRLLGDLEDVLRTNDVAFAKQVILFYYGLFKCAF